MASIVDPRKRKQALKSERVSEHSDRALKGRIN